MTKEHEQAIQILQNEYLCVDRDCDIERSCGKCDLMMPSKEPILKAYKVAIQAIKDLDNMQGVLDEIRAEIQSNMEIITGKYDSSVNLSDMPSYKIERNKAREECLQIIDKYRGESKNKE